MIPTLTATLGRLMRARAPAPVAELKSAAPVVAFEGFAAPAWSGRDYTALAREGLVTNPVVYRSVRMVAEAVAAIPIGLTVDGVAAASHPLLDLLTRPNDAETNIELIDAIVCSLLMAGSSTLQATAVGTRVAALYALRPDRVRWWLAATAGRRGSTIRRRRVRNG